MNSAEAAPAILYSPAQIAWGSFIGTPFAGCWFINRNFRHLGDQRKASQFLLWGFVISIVVFVATLFLPESFPTLGVPIGYTAALYFLARRLFAELPNDFAGDIEVASNWRVAGVSILWLLAVCIVGFVLIEFVPEGYFPGE
jgi:hypothetical protein